MIPKELKKIRQWTISKDTSNLKRPAYTKYKPNGALTYERAKELAGDKKYMGFYVTTADPYMLIDVDHVNPETLTESLPPKFLKFFLETRTYCETSPSGKGIRIIYKLPTAKDKELVNGNTFYTTELADKKNIQVSFGPPWCTITGKQLPYSHNSVATVKLDKLKTLFNFKFKIEDTAGNIKTTFFKDDVPSLSSLYFHTMRIPINQSDRVRRAYEKVTGCTYEHYAFWLKILMALHHYQTVSENKRDVLPLAIKWSAQDEENYKGESDVIQKWRSFDEDRDETVTYLTIYRMSAESNIKWPYPKARKKDDDPYQPLITQIANFKELLKFNNIKFHRSAYDRNIYYITGDTDILEKYFNRYEIYFEKYYGPYDVKTLSYVMLEFAQDQDFIGITLTAIQGYVKAIAAEVKDEVNFFRRYLDTPFDELPENMKENGENASISNFETLWGCIKLPNGTSEVDRKLYRTLFYKWFMGLIRNLYYEGPHRTNSGLLLLTGAEQTYKTSFFRYLLPEFFRSEVAFTTQGFSTTNDLRDVTKIAAQSMVVVFDEIEQHFTGDTAEASFKKLLDSEPSTFIDKYEVSPTTYVPKAIYGGTSNQSEFKLSSLGLRRIFHIPVRRVDTDTELKLCWWYVLNGLRKEYDEAIATGETPWSLPDLMVTQLSAKNASLKSETNLEILLGEIWDYDHKFDRLKDTTNFQHDPMRRLMRETDIFKIISVHEAAPNIIRRTALRHALKRKCSEYTGTLRDDIQIYKPRCIIHNGMAKQGSHYRWVMPPLKKHVSVNVQDEYFED